MQHADLVRQIAFDIKRPISYHKSTNAKLKKYGLSGYRFQFADCHGRPGTLNIKAGKKFMLDNRDGKARAFVIAKNTYNIKAYDFALATADKIGKDYITCDGGGAATIYVEK